MVVPNPLRQTVCPATVQIPVFSLVPLISPKSPINYSEMLERSPSEQHSVLWAQTTSREWAHVPYLQPTLFPVNSYSKSIFQSLLLAVHVIQTLTFLANTLHIIVTCAFFILSFGRHFILNFFSSWNRTHDTGIVSTMLYYLTMHTF